MPISLLLRLACAILFLSCCTVLPAQRFYYGIQAGIDRADLYNYAPLRSAAWDFVPIYAGSINLVLGEHFSDKFSASIEPGLRTRGARMVSGALEVTDFSRQYIQLPAVVSIALTPRLRSDIGLEIAYALNSTSSHLFIPDRRWDQGAIVGFRYEISRVLNLGFRFHHSLTNAHRFYFTDVDGNLFDEVRSYQSSLQLFLRAQWPF